MYQAKLKYKDMRVYVESSSDSEPSDCSGSSDNVYVRLV